ncbi:MAG: DUF2339 domain-containing protein [Prevotellaceae bacterium]|nr:DUF2339 domain-containing protein [Prevotellaceae bacterium]
MRKKLAEIITKQNGLLTEMQQLKSELDALEWSRKVDSVPETNPTVASHSEMEVLPPPPPIPIPPIPIPPPPVPPLVPPPIPPPLVPPPVPPPIPIPPASFKPKEGRAKSNIEKFIGENLISKIGIAIVIVGVALGAKYSIDNQLISPSWRIILAYTTGAGLLAFGIKLKRKYERFSAVLASGAIAIMYFVTYFASAYYSLIPQFLAFPLMFVFTVFAVYAAIQYNRPVIALVGLAGAYAVPFFFSGFSGDISIMFAYMTLINSGILAISYRKYWKSLYFSSFALTWFIYALWYGSALDPEVFIPFCFGAATSFLTIFWAIFYGMFMLYKLARKEKYTHRDAAPLLINSFLFYGFGCDILNGNAATEHWTGAFTLANAAVHGAVAWIVHRSRLDDKTLFYLVVSLVIVFVTLAVPVQLSGGWVTLLWAVEACFLFAFGRIKRLPALEAISYPLTALAFSSLIHDWTLIDPSRPFFDLGLLTSAGFIGSFAAMFYVQFKYDDSSVLLPKGYLRFFLLIALYFSGYLEVYNFYNGGWQSYSYEHEATGLMDYSLIFVSVLSLLNCAKLKSAGTGTAAFLFSVLFLLMFLVTGLQMLNELRDAHLFRYVSLLIVGLNLYAMSRQTRLYGKPGILILFDVLLHVSLLWIFSNEIIYWCDGTKTGMSVLWGAYALPIIARGILKKKKHLRVGGIALLGVTLLKLFFYDLTGLNTLSKTAVLVILGVVLLIVSFLYNKYKHLIDED